MLYVWNFKVVGDRGAHKITSKDSLNSFFFDNFLIGSVGSIICRNECVLDQLNNKSINVVPTHPVICDDLYFYWFPHKTNIFYFIMKLTFKMDLQSHFSSRKTSTIHWTFCHLTLILVHFLTEGLTDDQWYMLILPITRISKIREVRYEFILNFGFISLGVKSPRNIFRQFYRKRMCIFSQGKSSFESFQHVLNCIEVFIS